MHLSLPPHYNTLWEKVIVTLEGLFPSTSLILSKLLYRNQADAKCSAKENMPSSSEQIRENETEPKGQCMGSHTKAGFVTQCTLIQSIKTRSILLVHFCLMSTSAFPYRLSCIQRPQMWSLSISMAASQEKKELFQLFPS